MRITRNQMFMEMAEVVAKRATCLRGNVGVVLINENSVVSLGYNGSIAGELHCSLELCDIDKACCKSVHAENNAIRHADEAGFESYSTASIYCTVQSCLGCSWIIANAGIKMIYFRYTYRDPCGLQMLIDKGISVIQILPNGSEINPITKEIIND